MWSNTANEQVEIGRNTATNKFCQVTFQEKHGNSREMQFLKLNKNKIIEIINILDCRLFAANTKKVKEIWKPLK